MSRSEHWTSRSCSNHCHVQTTQCHVERFLKVTAKDFSMSCQTIAQRHVERCHIERFFNVTPRTRKKKNRTVDVTFKTLKVKLKGHCWYSCHVPSDFGLIWCWLLSIWYNTVDTTPYFNLWGCERFFEELVQFLDTCMRQSRISSKQLAEHLVERLEISIQSMNGLKDTVGKVIITQQGSEDQLYNILQGCWCSCREPAVSVERMAALYQFLR